MSTSLPPLCQKKPQSAKTMTDTFRVIREDPGPCFDSCTGLSVSGERTPNVNILGQPVLRRPVNESRNRPCPRIATHITSNVRTMMASIPLTRTAGVDPECGGGVPASPWWEHSSSLKPSPGAPPRSFDSTSRYDFQYRGAGLPGNRRHGFCSNSNPEMIGAPRRATEGDNGMKTLWRENVSYEHHYNSRADPNYAVRGKRQGTFVLNKLQSQDADRMLSLCEYTDSESGGKTCSQNAASNSDQLPQAEVPRSVLSAA